MRLMCFQTYSTNESQDMSTSQQSSEGECIKTYRKVPKFWNARKLCCNVPKIQTKRPNLWLFHQKDVNGIASSEDPGQTAPLRAI